MDPLHRILWSVLGAFVLFYAVVKFSLGYWKRRGILHAKPTFLWGNISDVVRGKRHLHQVLESLYANYKGRAPFIGCYAFLKPFILVLDVQLVENILNTNAGYFTSRGLYNNVEGDPLSGNLLQLDGHRWRKLHAKSSPVFAYSQLQKMLPQLEQISGRMKRLLSQARHQQEINVSKLVENYNVEAIALLTYGLNCDELVQFIDLISRYWSNWSLWRAYFTLELPLLARLLNYKSYTEVATEYFQRLVPQQLQRARQPNFIQLYADTNESMTNAQIAAQAFSFILAGLQPLSASLAFCLYELALAPEVQHRVRTEIMQTLQAHDGRPTSECLKELVYTTQVLNETLRLHTPYPFLLRRATREFELPKSVFVIARGNNVLIPVAAIHRDPAIYTEPERFNPSRFESKAQRARPAMSFLPFGEGLRGCIAKELAQQQLLVALVALLEHHKYTTSTETEIPMTYDSGKLVLMPKKDIKLRVEWVDS